jgi:SBDS protein, C-terminal domain
VATIEPKNFRAVNEIVSRETKGGSSVKVLELFAAKSEEPEGADFLG